ncbi:NlpC/P60 family protein [Pinisolibacter sp.]|uniref:NlpC/P60 family protein n=1 Tax=Pinisolibacter sp. TaxID=2172024 RepID=UPI002FDEAC7C
MSDIRAIQSRLAELGYDPGPIDGEDGDLTKAAVKQFQRARGLVADGIVGPLTRMQLWPNRVAELAPAAPAEIPPWLKNALAEIGVKEKAGRDSNGRIIAYRILGKTTDDTSTEDGSRPWCGDFVCAMLETAGVRSPRSGMARAIEHDPNFVRLDGPALGAIVTMWRGSKSSGLGHVYEYAGQTADGRNVGVGGNQNDEVSAAAYGTSRLVGYWWPKSVPLPKTGHVPAIIRPGATAGREV